MKRRWIAWPCFLIICLIGPSFASGSQAMSEPSLSSNDVAPVVVQHTPAGGEQSPLDQAISVTFDRPMDRSKVERAFSLSPRVEGRFEWPDERTVKFLPSEPLERDVEYTATITTEAADRDGVTLAEAFTFRFWSVGYLQVTQVIPAPDSTEIEVNSTITVMFNRPVVPLTALAQQTGLPQPLTFDPPVKGQGQWLNTSVYVFTPDGPLAGGMPYRVVVEAGLSDSIGNILADDYTWGFTTQPPQVVWLSPEDGRELVAVDATISVGFNQEVDCRSAEEAFVLVKRGSDAPIEGKASCSGPYFNFQPLEWLEFDTVYQARLSPAVTGQAGGLGMREGRVWRFRTVPLPRIVSTSPTDGERNASPYTSFSIKFNAPIDPATVMDNLTFIPAIEATKAYTYFNESDLTFSVDFGAQPSSDYRVDIGPDIRDRYGNKTGQTMTVRFRTAALKPQAQLATPGQVSTADANEPVSLFVRYLNTRRLQFRLYRLDLKQMNEALGNWWDFSPPRRGLVRKWTLDVEAPENKWQNLPVALNESGKLLAPGVYWVSMAAQGVRENRWYQSHLIVVSPINLTIKSDWGKALVWATDFAGQPVQRLNLRLLDYDLKPGDESRTQADGLAVLNLAGVNRSEFYVVSESPFALGSSRWRQGIEGSAFGYDHHYAYPGARVHIYTDRSIYRAGQTVYFKGIVRYEQDASYDLPRSREVALRAWDSAGQEVLNQNVTLDEFGTFYGELTLKPDAALGYYNLQARFENRNYSTRFQVAAYRPPEFQVEVKPAVAETVAGERSSATVNVSYFFGGPVSDAPVKWNILAQRFRYQSKQFSRYSFSDPDDPWTCFDCWWRPPQPPTPVLSGEGRTDNTGKLLIEIPGNINQLAAGELIATPEQIFGSRELTIEASVSGPDGSVISGRDTMVVHQGAFYIGLAPRQIVGHAGKEVVVDLVTVDWHDNRVPNQPLNVQIYRREWVNQFVEYEGGGHWEWETKDEFVGSSRVTTDEKAQAAIAFTPDKGGSYRIVVNGRDETERLVQSSVFVWVSSPENVSWRRENHDRIDLIADKTTYQVGDVAEILIPSPFEGEQWALVTVERGGILSYEVVKMPNNSYVYRLPITAEHIPNIYVSAVIMKGKDADNKAVGYKVGYTALDVDIAPVKLNITVTPKVEQAEPGSTVDLELRVTDDAGEPVETELSLDVVDKAVLSLLPREPDAIVKAFYERRGLGVQTASGLTISLNRLLLEQIEEYAEDEGQQAELMAGLGEGDGLMTRAPGAPMPAMVPAMKAAAPEAAPPPGVPIREEFADTAYWNPTVVTGADGRAALSVKVPDNLTTWTVRGVGLTKDTRVGEGLAELLVTKPVLIRPVAPRFFVVGDKARLSALVSNNTADARDVEVTLSATGLELADPARQRVRIETKSEAEVTWNVSVTDAPNVEVIFSAVSGDYADAARPRLTTGPNGTLLIHRYTAPDIVGTGGQLDAAGSRTEVVALPPRYDDREGTLDVRLDPSLAAGMQDGLRYLKHFPYECSEQIVSKFLPNVLTYRALAQLGIRNEELEAELPDLVKEALDKLYVRQHEDGGWGWWSTGESNPQVSAYVVFAMNKAIESDFKVNGETFERGLKYLRSQLMPVEDIKSYREANLQAFILYVLTDTPGNAGKFTEQVDDLFDNREKLSHFGKAFLAMTIGRLSPQDAMVKTLLSDLQNSAILSATGAHWEEQDYDYWAMNTDTRSTAIILNALTKLDPNNALNPNVVRWLMVARKDGIWESTQETAWALIALTDWMVMTGELKGEYDYRISLNGQERLSSAVDHSNIREQARLTIQVAELLKDQGNRLTVSRGEGPGRLYYTAHLRVYLPVAELEPVDRGISVSREYTPPGCGFGDKCAEVNEAQVGDVVQVRLTITAPHDRYYVIVEDPLPAGAEAIDTGLSTTSLLERDPTLARLTDKNDPWNYFYRWWWNWYSRSEMRDDKVVLFADYLPAGTYQYVYTFRAYIPGEYQVIPTVASEMYFPEVFGRSDGRLFTIR